MEAHREAFEKIFRDHLSQVERLIARHTRDPEERLDLTQEVFIRAYSAFSQFRGESSVSTWLHRIAINVCANAARTRSRQPEEPVGDVQCVNYPDGLYDVVEDLAHAERQRMLKQALRLLSAEQLVVLTLRFSDQLKIHEIAEVIGAPVDTVKSRLKAALHKIHAVAGVLGEELSDEAGLAALSYRGVADDALSSDEDAISVSLDKLLPQGEKAARVYQKLGSLYLQKGLIEAALAEWRNAQKADPTFLDAYLLAAQQYIETDRPRKAVETLEAAVSKIQSCELHTTIAKLYMDQGDIDEGLKHSLRALDLDPCSPEAHYQTGRAYSKRAELQEALRSLSVGVREPEDSVQADWRRSASHFERALELKPGFAQAASFLSGVYLSSNRPEDAERTSEDAARMAENDSLVLHRAAWIHYHTRKLELAERYLRRSISAKATGAKLNLLGLVYLAGQRYEEAYMAFGEGLNYDGDKKIRAQLYANLAAAAVYLEKYEEAIDAAESALKLDPEQIHARCNLSHAYLARGIDPHIVVKLCREGLQKSPGHRCFHYYLAEAYLRTGDYEEALAEATTAVEIDPQLPDRWVLRAKVLCKLNRDNEARRDIATALELDPNHSDANRLAEQLQEKTSPFTPHLETSE